MKIPTRLVLFVGTACLVVLPAAASAGLHVAASQSHAVALKEIKITPKTLKIHRGENVVWTWGDRPLDAQHNVTSYGKLRFRSSVTQFEGIYKVRFARKGVYLYRCTVHPGAMKGKIIVK